MKNFRIHLKIIVVVFVTMTIISCKENNNKVEEKKSSEVTLKKEESNTNKNSAITAEFRNSKATEAFKHYIDIKTALVKSDSKKAKKSAEELVKVLPSIALKKAAEIIINTDNIEDQRKAFSTVSLLIETIVKETMTTGEIYKQHCPMAFDNKGAYWLSKEKEIRNPYFGDRMLKCGSVTETIKK
ncbi:DUF3347 domain-containing protein [Aquimarina muelleri]|uniref:DUF3347 domain-containing protein n=1 Tax=Aquimarina muelleri TaxID=279356 RepID=A0A918JTX2_9FLAO|nr:DUF3347 domain-containing protein [Aquimarina muelleri]MCX2763459.1 DUF3347 domain-containing protein [Aquimarina muelleri]GGX02553.1 hypothetical protein GCM10007384_00340 [Aquimarina muelleri]